MIDPKPSAAPSWTCDDDAIVLARLGDVTVAVCSPVALVRETVAEFYPSAAAGAVPQWTVTALGEPVPTGMRRTSFGVGVQVDAATREVMLWSASAFDLAVTARKVVREVFLAACEQAGYTMVHASAVYTDEQVVVFAADKRGGKTTLALRAVLDRGWRWLSNDHLILLPDGHGGLTATSLPTPIPVKAGTLVDLWDRLPAPWDANGFDIQAWRQVPVSRRHAADDAAYFTFARFGQPNPVLVPLASLRISVVFPRYAGSDETVAAPTVLDVPAAAAELAGHVRTDWLANDRLHQRHLPFEHRDPGVFAADGARLTRRLAELGDGGCRYVHRGNPGPLLDALAKASR
ncbi:hypothetical protein ACLQ24_29165 [Micromonospora sp. DT4]|uniref:hypothetical protein n=1 Tax=Micromonospora sp. DT4 TaxID=3393438 RepID=UPI003CFA631D